MHVTDYSQAVDNSASFSTLPLPLVHLSQQVEESLLGVGNIAIRRPAQELELTHHQLALLELQRQRKTLNTWNVSVLYCYNFWLFQYFCVRQLTPVFECSPGCLLALSAVLTQQTDFEIYGSAGVSEARAVSGRGPRVFITLSCRISPNT